MSCNVTGPHAVYRIYGSNNVILYIGCTRDPDIRLRQHKWRQRNRWWPLVQRYEIDWYPNYHKAIDEETRQLRLYRPICNPVIPDETGKNITAIDGLNGVRSLWDQRDRG